MIFGILGFELLPFFLKLVLVPVLSAVHLVGTFLAIRYCALFEWLSCIMMVLITAGWFALTVIVCTHVPNINLTVASVPGTCVKVLLSLRVSVRIPRI